MGDGEENNGLDPEEASPEEIAVALTNLEAKVDQMVMQRLNALSEAVDERDETIDVLTEELEACQSRLSVLEEKLAGLAGLEKEEKSTPEKRREDLVLSLQRKAEDGAGKDDNNFASMTYEQVLDQWAVLNHGRLDPKQAYRAMERVAEVDGITLTANNAGQKVVRMNLDSFDASTALGTVDNVNNAGGRDGSQNAVSTSD